MLERLKIFEYDKPYMFVLFDHNPEQLKVTRRAKRPDSTPAPRSTPSIPGGSQATTQPTPRGGDPTRISISKARLVGAETKLSVDQLFSWLSPGESPFSMASVKVATVEAPTLLMQWGPPKMGFTFTCKLTQVDVTYIRVSMAGVPTHALVNLSLDEFPDKLPMTNPTSGGRPGRQRHVVLAGETLASIATDRMRSPGAWRAIADVNGIDDPNAIRPGDVVYLPAADELAQFARSN